MYRNNCKYTPDHQWVDLTARPCKIGITDRAQLQAGSIVFVALPREGSHCVSGEPYITIETCDAIVELLAPFSGRVTAVNSSMNSQPANLNLNPHDHWLVMLSDLPDDTASRQLLEAEQYRQLIGDAVSPAP